MKKLKEQLDLMWMVTNRFYLLQKPYIPVMIITKLLYGLMPFINIVMTAKIVDKLSYGANVRELALLASITVGANVLLSLCANGMEQLRQMHVYTLSRMYRLQFMYKMSEIDYEYIEDPKTHNMLSRIQSNLNMGWWDITSVLEQIVSSMIGLILSGVLSYRLFITGINNSYGLLLGFTALVALCMWLIAVADKGFLNRIYKVLDGFSERERAFNYMSELVGNYKNGKDIRIYNAKELIGDASERMWREGGFASFKSLSKMDGMMKGIKGGITALMGGVIYIFVAIRAVTGYLSVGSIVRYAGGVNQFINHFSGLVNALNTYSLNCERMRIAYDFLNLPDKKYRGSLPVEKRKDHEYIIEFHHVSFKYPGSEVYVLKDLCLRLRIGQRMAVVGQNGSGKTTMIKLLCRLYDPTEGMITLNGIDIKKYSYEEYLGLFSVVFQDFRLYAFPMSENISSSVTYDLKKMSDVIERSGLSKRVSRMQHGADTYLYTQYSKDGVEISGGEAQKIALARALFKDSHFVILDEPTAALDPIAEFEVYSRFNDIVGKKTAVYISHRLSSCRFCDDIAVFHEGRLIQRGSHNELIADISGKYKEIWDAQAQYYAAG